MKEFKYEILAKELSSKIRQRIWQPGDRLPSIRQLSQQHNLAKVSVQHALHFLEAGGLVEARPQSGYYVRKPATVDVSVPNFSHNNKPDLVEVPDIFHEIMSRSAAFDLCPSAPLHDDHPHLQLLYRQVGRAQRQQSQTNAVYYNAPQGNTVLRQQIQNHYKTRDCALEIDEICITAGCQNSLFIALMACCDAGDTIAIESPAFYGVLQIAQQLKLKVVEVPCSTTTGLRTQDLATMLEKWPIKACVVTPCYATPSGASMPYQEKQKLVDLAHEHDIFLIEDDIYGDLGFHLQPEPLKHFDRDGKVILCSSFSKSLSRDLRIGWICGGALHDKIVHLKLVNQLASGDAVQSGLADFLAEGHFKRHLIRYRHQLRQRRDNLVDSLKKHWRGSFHYTVPEGGLALWVALPPRVDTQKLYLPLLQQGIVITPGVLFSSQPRYRNYLRLSFAHTLDAARLDALIRLGQHIDQYKH